MLNGSTLNGQALNGGRRRVSRETEVVGIPAASRWRLRVVLDGVDVSARLTGQVGLDREEGAARLARLSLLPQPGELDLDQFTGKHLVIYRQRVEGDVVVAEQLRFTGSSQRPRLNITSLVVAITATCDMPNRVEGMTIEQIDALVPGFYAVGVFGEIEGHWQYAQDRCSTLPASLETSVEGNLRINHWRPSPVPHFSFDSGTVLDGSIEIEPADAGQLINLVEISLDYRYSRLRHREHSFSWAHPAGSFCAWRVDSSELPTLAMVLDGADQSDWALLGSPGYEELPPSGPNLCGDGIGWLNEVGDEHLLLRFSLNVAMRTSQSLTEQYRLTLRAEGSIAAFGERAHRENYGDEVEFDSRSWEDATVTGRPAGSHQDDLGDWVIDQEDGRRDNLLTTALQREYVRMLESHRMTRLRFQTPITDAVYDTTQTMRLAVHGTRAAGKVVRVQETYDMDAGTEVASVELAIRRGGAVSLDEALLLPARPAFNLGAAPAAGTNLATQIGGRLSSPPYDEALGGFSGNYSIGDSSAEKYPRRLQFDTPEVAAEHRDPAEAESVRSYSIGLASDELVTEVV